MQKPRVKARLPADATLRSIVGNLEHPEEFVRAVFANMRGGRDELGMRVALNSNPQIPDYCIEMYFEERNTAGEWEIVGCQFLAAFSGRNHKESPLTGGETARLWSNESMSWENVQILLAQLRGISMTPKPSLRARGPK